MTDTTTIEHPAETDNRPTDSDAGLDAAHGDSAIIVRGLGRSFDGTTAVDGLDLSIASGEIYGFLGPNGAGKSTTVRMLCTLLAPTSGSATVAGFDVESRPDQVRLRIGAALQEAALDPLQTGDELLRLQGRLYGLTRREIDGRLRQLAELIDLGDALHRPIKTYSGGMSRRLDLAASLVHNPDVLFLDEPTTGLDPVSRASVWDEVRRLNETLGMTIFLTTQYLEEADVLADRVGIINGGRLVAEGTPEQLKRSVGDDVIIARVGGDVEIARDALSGVAGVSRVDDVHDELVIATANGAATVGPVAIALGRAGVDIHDLTLRTTTLDDVFLEVTGNRIRDNEPSPEQSDRSPAPTTEATR
ncbi:ATP-binding cassette domain-containing protein [Ilumatobacter sp.]|uniref:ATP-binding cassette domain-containing protein n=1 Tax=Ilumatobacter sp. TaxID=1967498 RepID=UPI003C36502A